MTTIAGEVRAAREGALIQEAPELGTLVVTGKDRQTWLNGLVTCDLAKLGPGDGAFGLTVAKNGKMQAELFVLLGKERLLVGVPRERAAELRDTFDRYLIMEDAAIVDASDEHAWVLAHGPLAAGLAELARVEGAEAAAVDRTGLGGLAAVASPASITALTTALLDRLGDRGARASAEGFTQLLLEQGLGRWGVDFGPECYPQEASLEKLAVSFNKGCYLGQETVYMLEVRGHVKRKLVPLTVLDASPVEKGAPITAPDGTPAGEVTSAGVHSTTGERLALGYVKYKLIAPGTELQVAGRPARVR